MKSTFKRLFTISDEEIMVRPNKSMKTFTIKKNGTKYRTTPMSRLDFEHADNYWTGNDWKQFFKTNEYYKVY